MIEYLWDVVDVTIKGFIGGSILLVISVFFVWVYIGYRDKKRG